MQVKMACVWVYLQGSNAKIVIRVVSLLRNGGRPYVMTAP